MAWSCRLWRCFRRRGAVCRLEDHVGAEAVAAAWRGDDQVVGRAMLLQRGAQRGYGHGDIGILHRAGWPDRLHQRVAGHQAALRLDQEQQRVEQPGGERHLGAVAGERTGDRIEPELREQVSPFGTDGSIHHVSLKPGGGIAQATGLMPFWPSPTLEALQAIDIP